MKCEVTDFSWPDFFESGFVFREGADTDGDGPSWLVGVGPFAALSPDKALLLALSRTPSLQIFEQEFYAKTPEVLEPRLYRRLDGAQWLRFVGGFQKWAFSGRAPGSLLHLADSPLEGGAADQSFFKDLFSESLRKIHSGELKKAVPWTFADLGWEMSPRRLASLLTSFADQKSDLFPFGFWRVGCGTVGVSPELLYRRTGSHLQTMALAGTRPAEASDFELQDEIKLNDEHSLVVQDVCEKLRTMGTITLHSRRSKNFGRLIHDFTPVSCELLAVNDVEIIRGLHPTPALGVFPSTAGTLWMRDLHQNRKRGFFGAPIGFSITDEHGQSEAQMVVAIRAYQWWADSATVKLMAGCGVTRDSDFALEWQEVCAKIRATQAMLTKAE